MFCPKCGYVAEEGTNFCKNCGVNLLVNNNVYSKKNVSEKSWLVTLLLCIFLGVFGVHRFYTGKIGTGILMLVTGGGFGIWILIDIILIVTDSFTDAYGLRLNKDTNRF